MGDTQSAQFIIFNEKNYTMVNGGIIIINNKKSLKDKRRC